MADPAAPTPAPVTHPINRTRRWNFAIGGIYLAAGLASLFALPGTAPFGLVSMAFGALILARAFRQRRLVAAVLVNNAAHDLLTQGRYDEALALLDTIPPASRVGIVGMAALSQRAYVLLAQGDAAGAVALSTQALALKLPAMARAQGDQYRLTLRANRALMLSATDDATGARAEAAFVDASPNATPALRGVVALARAVTHARSGARADLVDELARSRAALEQLTGREAVLARTLARFAAVPAGGAYRAPAARNDGELSAAGRWIVAMVPSAAPFAPRREERADPVDPARLPPPTDDALAHVRADRARALKAAPNPGRLLAAAVAAAILALIFLATWTHGALREYVPVVLPLVFAVGYGTFIWRRNRRIDRVLRDARALYAEGREDESDALLDAPSRDPVHAYAALALLQLAEHDERRDELASALDRVDRAVGRLDQNARVKAATSDILLPSLLGLRARLLAALGSTDDALAQLALIAREHPTFPFATATTLLVRIIVALRLGDRSLARDLARTRSGDTHLPRHAELLLALLLGEEGWFEADGERERIEAELAASPGARAWVERLAPGLTTALRATTGVRVAGEASLDEDHPADDAIGRGGSFARRS